MTSYKCPNPDTYSVLRFVRNYNGLFLGNTIRDRHCDIVAIDKIKEAVEVTRKTEPAQVDAGFVEFLRDGTIIVNQCSDILNLPVSGHVQEAREITLKCFQEQSPGRTVVGKERY